MEFITHHAQETEALGAALAQRLQPGDILAFCGDLGAGKTALTRGIARGLGIAEAVTSPTYTIVNEYMGRLPLFHFDLYRLSSAEELWEIGWEDYCQRGGICAVEWSERATEAMEGAILVQMEYLDENTRKITLTGGNGFVDFSL